MSASTQLDELLDAWKEFTILNRMPPTIPPNIAQSWRRCRGRFGPKKTALPKQFSREYLLASQVVSFDLISLARPVMEDLYQFVEGTGAAVLFINNAVIILDYCGDIDIIELMNKSGIYQGTLLSESEIGTNAFGLAMIDRFPSSVVGAQHYLKRFHNFGESASPVFDISGRPLGAIGLITLAEKHSPYALSSVVAGARAIESQIQSEHLLVEQNSRLAELNAVLAANSEAIFVWNSDRVLMHMNPAAADLLDIPQGMMLGRHIGEFISYPKLIRDAVEAKKELNDVEVNIEVDGRSIKCVINMRYVFKNNDLQWITINARKSGDIRRLVQKQVGAHASLSLSDLIGESKQMKSVRRFVKTAAHAKASVIIRGESGTGKNPVASAIHNESPRRDGPFMIYPCSSIPSEILVQEMLGFDQGVSENMPGGRPSKFELVNHGTMYFQDVEALPLEAQGVLLNVIDLGIVQRLGSKRPIEVDVRIIAATSSDLEDMITQGNFRSDLFYRLSSMEIRLPSLRERREDIPLLLDRIIGRLSKQINRSLEYNLELLDILTRYSWPGNLREFEAVINRAAAHAGLSGKISVEHLPAYVRNPGMYSSRSGEVSQIKTMDEVERENIINAAVLCMGNTTKMAKYLGISRTTLWRKLKNSELELSEYKNRTSN